MDDQSQIPIYSRGHCPDTLAWNDEENTCTLECIFPFYSESEESAFFITDHILGVIGFTLCYFYCFTALFRPIMQKFPNSNIFFLHLSLMSLSAGLLIPLILSPRYVFCETNTKPANTNWACLLSGKRYF